MAKRKVSERMKATLRKTILTTGQFNGWFNNKQLRAKLMHDGTYISWGFGGTGRPGGGMDVEMAFKYIYADAEGKQLTEEDFHAAPAKP